MTYEESKRLVHGDPVEVYDRGKWRRTTVDGRAEYGWVYVAPFPHFLPGVYRIERVRRFDTITITVSLPLPETVLSQALLEAIADHYHRGGGDGPMGA